MEGRTPLRGLGGETLLWVGEGRGEVPFREGETSPREGGGGGVGDLHLGRGKFHLGREG